MTKIQITEEIRNNMNTVTSTIRQICDKDGNFEMDELVSVSGLHIVEIKQAIAFLKKSGHDIEKMHSDFGYWQDQKVYWARRDLAKAGC
jgi:hypothetical protein